RADDRRVGGDDGVSDARSSAPLEASLDGGVHRHAVERQTEELSSRRAIHLGSPFRPESRAWRATREPAWPSPSSSLRLCPTAGSCADSSGGSGGTPDLRNAGC